MRAGMLFFFCRKRLEWQRHAPAHNPIAVRLFGVRFSAGWGCLGGQRDCSAICRKYVRGAISDTAHFCACAIAWAFAPLTASRNGPAAAGADTRPSSVARVEILLPYMARLDWLSARTNAPLNVNPRKAPLARE